MKQVNYALKLASEAYKNANYDIWALPPTLRVVRLIDQLDFEVTLGGVLGWLVNMGDRGPETTKALEAVGAYQCAAIVREIMAFFPEGSPAVKDQERVIQIMDVEDVAEPRWSELGDRLLSWPDDIYVLLQKFINEHEADFT